MTSDRSHLSFVAADIPLRSCAATSSASDQVDGGHTSPVGCDSAAEALNVVENGNGRSEETSAAIRKAETTHPNSLESTFETLAAAKGKNIAEDGAGTENEKMLSHREALSRQAHEIDD